MLAASGHKGMLGPLGTGVLCLGERLIDELQPLRRGGTGTASEDERQPTELPERFEAGNLNVPALAGLAAATEYLQQQTIEAYRTPPSPAYPTRLLSRIGISPGRDRFTVREADQPRTSVVSFTCVGYDPQELSARAGNVGGDRVSRRSALCPSDAPRALGTLARRRDAAAEPRLGDHTAKKLIPRFAAGSKCDWRAQ